MTTTLKIEIPEKIETSYFDTKAQKFIVQESKDGGKTWVTVREYDTKGWKITI